MITKFKVHFQQFRGKTSFADKLQLLGFAATIISLLLVFYQLRESTNTNKVSIRGQLYQAENGINAGEAEDGKSNLSSVWAFPQANVEKQARAEMFIKFVSDDAFAISSKNAGELYLNIFGSAVFGDKSRKKKTANLRKMFLFVQSNLYHVHNANAFDYRKEKVLDPEEWKTWKGIIREMHGHPMLLAVVAQGHRYRYFSKAFAIMLQEELCADPVPSSVADVHEYERTREFIRYFYPDIFDKKWPDAMPNY